MKELNVWRKSVGQEEQHAFCIAGLCSMVWEGV